MLYGALHDTRPSGAPEGCIWTKQIDQPLDWIWCFLAGHKGAIVRTMQVDSHFRRGVRIDITTDASPWGIGGFLCIDGVAAEYFYEPVTEEDARHIGVVLSRDSKCQQVFEALAILVALRLWRYYWSSQRVVLHVSTDNIAALSMICKMQPHSPTVGVIAREISLDVADAIYEPQVASHVPGISNIIADTLSRRYDPGKADNWKLPSELDDSTQGHPAKRTTKWWRSVDASRLRQIGKGGDDVAR